ncbi:MAG: pyridoxamine 5'-phosphate oxidase family protein [Limnoraphis robusta]|uniref:Pyridoxamine 5'-phosphate oxidase n=1 Tax=Limnoraphis robusta CS-951 TaxID=1637645 RepID=A0A0F5YFY7_9CYAN|nr:pyridoxamine 5'-phosphate oxidase family protein [Limnoraphis robusta]KKD37673.1 pyridoxamine 5'-phosphate oxidase [Limnoraphis robusta CS-951]
MPRKFAEIAFTPAVKAIQERYGSREMYNRMEESGPENDTLIPRLVEFIQARDSFYMGTVNENGWPYIQFRGGPIGFLKILDEKTLGFADFEGNCQYLSLGNLSVNDRVFLFLMDYTNRRRLKIWGRATVEYNNPNLLEQLRVPGYEASCERAILIHVEAWDWNCPQHIPIKYSEAQVTEMIAPLQTRIQELEAQLASIQTPNS